VDCWETRVVEHRFCWARSTTLCLCTNPWGWLLAVLSLVVALLGHVEQGGLARISSSGAGSSRSHTLQGVCSETYPLLVAHCESLLHLMRFAHTFVEQMTAALC